MLNNARPYTLSTLYSISKSSLTLSAFHFAVLLILSAARLRVNFDLKMKLRLISPSRQKLELAVIHHSMKLANPITHRLLHYLQELITIAR